jgi:hypothetical protein
LWAFAGLIIYPGVNERGELVTPAMVWFIATCTTDVALALALWIMIRKMRAATPFRSTQRSVLPPAAHRVRWLTEGPTACSVG